MLRVTQRRQGGATVLVLEGWIVSETLPVLDAALREAASPFAAVVLDLRQILYLDNLGAARLRRLRRSGVRLVNVSEIVAGILED